MHNSVILLDCRTYTTMKCMNNGLRMESACSNPKEGSATSLSISFSSTPASYTTSIPWKSYCPLPWLWLSLPSWLFWGGGGWRTQNLLLPLLNTNLTLSPFHPLQVSVPWVGNFYCVCVAILFCLVSGWGEQNGGWWVNLKAQRDIRMVRYGFQFVHINYIRTKTTI